MRVMVVTWSVQVGFSVSAWQKRYISEKCSKIRVLRSPKSRPSANIRFDFWGFWGIFWSKFKDKNDDYTNRLAARRLISSWRLLRCPKRIWRKATSRSRIVHCLEQREVPENHRVTCPQEAFRTIDTWNRTGHAWGWRCKPKAIAALQFECEEYLTELN